MKKAAAILITLMVIMTAASGMACEGCSWEDYRDTEPLTWKTYLVSNNFPESVIRDVSALCQSYHGTQIECLGLTCNKGSNLRAVTNFRDSGSSILRKLHANITVYVHFSFYDANGNEWYYVTCSDGLEGFLLASRILLIPVS